RGDGLAADEDVGDAAIVGIEQLTATQEREHVADRSTPPSAVAPSLTRPRSPITVAVSSSSVAVRWSVGTRRLAMLKTLAVVVAVVATLVGTVTSAPAQKRGGVLKFAVPSVKPGLDPAHTSTGDGYMLTQAIFSNLTRIDESLEAKPQLAKAWDANAQSTVWTFHLHQGVKFHHGRELTADDVVFSIDRILDPKTASRGAKALGPIKKVVAKDRYTVVFELTGAYADLPLQLGTTYARIV